MELTNNTSLQAGFTLAFEPDGRELLVVAVKGTYAIPLEPGGTADLVGEQVPLTQADEFTGEPGYSATLYETDYAPRKPRCDILLNGCAYAPGGRATSRITVSLKVRHLTKAFNIVGNRLWRVGMFDCEATEPEPFTEMPISYNNAFGGIDRPSEDPATHRWYSLNHAGLGFHEDLSLRNLDGKPLPNTEEMNNPVASPRAKYAPMAFGPLGRAWEPRAQLAGTYDQQWLDNRAPFWPDDFDWRYFQAAPPDQQLDCLTGGEDVLLRNLTPDGERHFTIPKLDVPVVLVYQQGKDVLTTAVADTLVLEPDNGRFTVTCRLSRPLRKNLFELREVVVGDRRRSPDPTWLKPRYASIEEYIRSRRKPKGDR